MPSPMPPHPLSPPRPAPARARRAAALLAGAAALAGCGRDPLEAASANNVETIPTAFVVYPFSSATGPLPTAISVGGLSSVRPAIVAAQLRSGGTILAPNFDFVVDRAAGQPTRLLPSKLIAAVEGTGRLLRTGARVVNTPFDSLASAPTGDYQRDSATAVLPGQTVVVETETVTCLESGRSFIYAKLVVDSVAAATGGIHFRALVNVNCGFRSLRPGRPTS